MEFAGIKVGDLVILDEDVKSLGEDIYNKYKEDGMFEYVPNLEHLGGQFGKVVKCVMHDNREIVFVNTDSDTCLICYHNKISRINKFRKGDVVMKHSSYSLIVDKNKLVTIDDNKFSQLHRGKVLVTLNGLIGTYDEDIFMDTNGLTCGDYVEIVNYGAQYSCFREFYNKYKTDESFDFLYGKSNNLNECKVGKIIEIAPHMSEKYDKVLALVNLENGYSGIFNIKGLNKIDKEIGMSVMENVKSEDVFEIGDKVITLKDTLDVDVESNKVYIVNHVYDDSFKFEGNDKMFLTKDFIKVKVDLKSKSEINEQLKLNKILIREQKQKIKSLNKKIEKYEYEDIDEETLNYTLDRINENCAVIAERNGRTIIARMVDEFGNEVSKGESKCKSSDEFYINKGLELACVRMIKNQYEELERKIIKLI